VQQKTAKSQLPKNTVPISSLPCVGCPLRGGQYHTDTEREPRIYCDGKWILISLARQCACRYFPNLTNIFHEIPEHSQEAFPVELARKAPLRPTG
jgi:hypothetical protein